MSRPMLRLFLGVLLPLTAATTLFAQSGHRACDRIFRLRAKSLDDLLRSAKDALQKGTLSAAAYPSAVGWLFAQEQQLYTEARAYHFQDITEATYWQRSRLKFPSNIDQEHDVLSSSR